MKNAFTKIVTVVSISGMVSVLGASAATAATVTGTFTVENLDPTLTIDAVYSGSYSYDDASLTGSDEEAVEVLSFSFDFEGMNYNNSNKADGTLIEAIFFDGEFLGINAEFENFDLLPGFFDTTDALFAYEIPDVGAGTGDIFYSSTPIPTPALLPGLVGMGVAALRKKRQEA